MTVREQAAFSVALPAALATYPRKSTSAATWPGEPSTSSCCTDSSYTYTVPAHPRHAMPGETSRVNEAASVRWWRQGLTSPGREGGRLTVLVAEGVLQHAHLPRADQGRGGGAGGAVEDAGRRLSGHGSTAEALAAATADGQGGRTPQAPPPHQEAAAARLTPANTPAHQMHARSMSRVMTNLGIRLEGGGGCCCLLTCAACPMRWLCPGIVGRGPPGCRWCARSAGRTTSSTPTARLPPLPPPTTAEPQPSTRIPPALLQSGPTQAATGSVSLTAHQDAGYRPPYLLSGVPGWLSAVEGRWMREEKWKQWSQTSTSWPRPSSYTWQLQH